MCVCVFNEIGLNSIYVANNPWLAQRRMHVNCTRLLTSGDRLKREDIKFESLAWLKDRTWDRSIRVSCGTD